MWRREEYKAIFTVLKASATVEIFTFESGIARSKRAIARVRASLAR